MPKHRAHGKGALFRRNKGTSRESWVARIYYEDGTRKEVYAQTQAEARQKLEELKRAAALGMSMRSPRQTVGQFLQDWLENAAKPKLRPRTFAGYRTIVNHYLVPHLGRVQLTKLTPQHVQTFQSKLLSTELDRGGGAVSPVTVINARRVLGRAMEQATHWGLIARNPVRLVDGPHLTRREIQPLDTEQARRLLAAVRGDRLEALYTVALALGLGRGEAMGLKWVDIDFATSTLYVHSARFSAATTASSWSMSKRKRAAARFRCPWLQYARCKSTVNVRISSVKRRQSPISGWSTALYSRI